MKNRLEMHLPVGLTETIAIAILGEGVTPNHDSVQQGTSLT